MNKQIKAGADIHAGDGGYSEGTQEEYEKFVKVRNQSLIKARIREFEKQSGLEIFGLGARREIWEAALEKYAELFVKECMSNLYLNGYDDAMNQIKQHFGVEE
jgi:hypothetical protein